MKLLVKILLLLVAIPLIAYLCILGANNVHASGEWASGFFKDMFKTDNIINQLVWKPLQAADPNHRWLPKFNKLVGYATLQRGHTVAFAHCRLLCVVAMFHRSLSTG